MEICLLSDDGTVLHTLCLLGFSSGFIHKSPVQRRFSATRQMSMVVPVKGGSVVALVTPMTENNEIDFPKFESLLQWHVKEGKHSFGPLYSLSIVSHLDTSIFCHYSSVHLFSP
jgi:hypothetical protein